MARHPARADEGREGQASSATSMGWAATAGLVLVGVCGFGLGLYRVSNGWRWDTAQFVDYVTLAYLLSPVVVVLLPLAGEFSIGASGVTWKRSMEARLAATQKRVGAAHEQLAAVTSAVAHGIGKRRAGPTPAAAAGDETGGLARHLRPLAPEQPSGGRVSFAPPTQAEVDPEDPQRGLWGGRPESEYRRLSADVRPLPGETELFQVKLKIRSTDPKGHPLSGNVCFHLHPTFTPQSVSVQVQDGLVILERIAWGAFTVGAEADEGRTRLELNLAELEGAPQKFRER